MSRIGLGSGGPSRLGRGARDPRAQGLAVVREALALGIDFFDSSEAYGTEALLGEALRGHARDALVLATKGTPLRDGALIDARALALKVDASLARLETDYVDLYLLHGLLPEHYDLACEQLVPALLDLRARGKLRFFGVSEAYGQDPAHRMLARAVLDPWWDALYVGYNPLDPTARRLVLPRAAELGIACVGMFAVSDRLRDPDAARATARDAIARGALHADALDPEAPLAPLCGADGAADPIEASYRFALGEPGLHALLIGTGSVDHLRANVASCAAGPLPEPGVSVVLAAFRPRAPSPATASVLGVGDRDAFRSRGFLCRPGAIDPATVEELREEAQRLALRPEMRRLENLRAEYRADAKGEGVLTKLDPACDLSAAFDAIAHDPRVLAPVRDLLGDEPVLLKDKLIYKPPGHPGFGCHQDHANWTPFSPRALTVFLALDPAPRESGPLVVYPGLHGEGLTLPGGEFRPSRHADTPPESLATPVPLAAGDLLLFHCLLPHRSGPNRTASARRALLLTYSPAAAGDRYTDYYRHYAAQRGAGSPANPEAHFEPPVRALDEPGVPRVVTGREPSRHGAPPPAPGRRSTAMATPGPNPRGAPRKPRSRARRWRRAWRELRRDVRRRVRALVAPGPE